MRRSVLVVGLFLVVMFSGPVNAAGTCSPGDSDNIMNLFDWNNSHGSLWNASTYTDTICYEDIFSIPYGGGGNPHECTGTNRLLSLNDVTNALASTTTDATYNVEVCYGDLDCVVDSTPGDACTNGGKVVVRLSDTTNAHISNASDTNYLEKICCTIASFAGGKEWRNTLNGLITNADIGDTVIMFDGDYTPRIDGAPVIFEVIEDDVLANPDDDIRTEALGNAIVGYYDDALGGAIGKWTITSADLALTNDLTDFKFSSNWSFSDLSSELIVSNVKADDPLRISISNPSCGTHLDVNTNITIDIFVYDIDDDVTGDLTIFDGISDSVVDFTFTNGASSFTYNFTNPGNWRIVAKASNLRGAVLNSSSIMVIDTSRNGKYLAACITRPAGLELITSSTVVFDARGTKGINYIVSPESYDLIGLGEMEFHWEIIDLEGGAEPIINKFKSGLQSYLWQATFEEVGRKVANLKVLV